jgi:hypothetical protein
MCRRIGHWNQVGSRAKADFASGPAANDLLRLTSRPRDFHPRALPEPYVNLSIHTAPDVRPLPWHSGQ